MLTTRVRPSGGHALVGGVDVVADPVHARGRLAVVPQRRNLDRSISIRRNLTFHAAYHGVATAEAEARASELLEQFGLLERGDVKPDLFSGGQAQRVMIARALMHQPQRRCCSPAAASIHGPPFLACAGFRSLRR